MSMVLVEDQFSSGPADVMERLNVRSFFQTRGEVCRERMWRKSRKSLLTNYKYNVWSLAAGAKWQNACIIGESLKIRKLINWAGELFLLLFFTSLSTDVLEVFFFFSLKLITIAIVHYHFAFRMLFLYYRSLHCVKMLNGCLWMHKINDISAYCTVICFMCSSRKK